MSDTTGAEVVKLYGAPGSGKTTRLIGFALRESNDGVPLDDVMFLTFSKAASEDAAERLGVVYPSLDEENPDHVRTLHGAALSQCIRSGMISLRQLDNADEPGVALIQKRNYSHRPYFEWFFKSRWPTIEYDTDADDPATDIRDGVSSDSAPGNRLLSIYGWLRSADVPLDQHHRTPFETHNLGIPQPEIVDVLRDWEDYKETNGLIQHDDYVHTAVENNVPAPARVLFIDEFQDLSPIQYQLYQQWRDSGEVDRIYIGGDVHQAIYGFRGAVPEQFTRTRTDHTVREEGSHRCPSRVIDAAKPIAEPVDAHDVSRVWGRKPGGTVVDVDAPDPEALGALVTDRVDEHGQVMLLARTNEQADKLAWGLQRVGIPYMDVKGENGSRDSWSNPIYPILRAVRTVVDETGPESDPLRMGDARALIEHSVESHHLPGMSQLDSLDGAFGDQIHPRGYRGWFPDADRPGDVLPELTVRDWHRDLIAGALDSGSTNTPEQVRIGTIHSAKGLEAPAVILSPAYSMKQLQRYRSGADTEAEERRLFYVGMTRAAESLTILHRYHGGQEFPPPSPAESAPKPKHTRQCDDLHGRTIGTVGAIVEIVEISIAIRISRSPLLLRSHSAGERRRQRRSTVRPPRYVIGRINDPTGHPP